MIQRKPEWFPAGTVKPLDAEAEALLEIPDNLKRTPNVPTAHNVGEAAPATDSGFRPARRRS